MEFFLFEIYMRVKYIRKKDSSLMFSLQDYQSHLIIIICQDFAVDKFLIVDWKRANSLLSNLRVYWSWFRFLLSNCNNDNCAQTYRPLEPPAVIIRIRVQSVSIDFLQTAISALLLSHILTDAQYECVIRDDLAVSDMSKIIPSMRILRHLNSVSSEYALKDVITQLWRPSNCNK